MKRFFALMLTVVFAAALLTAGCEKKKEAPAPTAQPAMQPAPTPPPPPPPPPAPKPAPAKPAKK